MRSLKVVADGSGVTKMCLVWIPYRLLLACHKIICLAIMCHDGRMVSFLMTQIPKYLTQQFGIGGYLEFRIQSSKARPAVWVQSNYTNEFSRLWPQIEVAWRISKCCVPCCRLFIAFDIGLASQRKIGSALDKVVEGESGSVKVRIQLWAAFFFLFFCIKFC